ncbi:MAG: hypothetical protein U0936_25615 [Planctomycetaceae bacterium]
MTIQQKRDAHEWLQINEPNLVAKQKELSQIEARVKALQIELQAQREEKTAIQEEKSASSRSAETFSNRASMGTYRVLLAQKEEAESWLREHGSLYEEAKQRLPLLQAELER